MYNKLLHNSAGLVSLTRWNCFSIIGLRWCSQASANLRHGLKRFERKILGVSAAAHKNLPTIVSAAHASRSAREKERGSSNNKGRCFASRNSLKLFLTVIFSAVFMCIFTRISSRQTVFFYWIRILMF